MLVIFFKNISILFFAVLSLLPLSWPCRRKLQRLVAKDGIVLLLTWLRQLSSRHVSHHGPPAAGWFKILASRSSGPSVHRGISIAEVPKVFLQRMASVGRLKGRHVANGRIFFRERFSMQSIGFVCNFN
jgi:hypothetical protein